MELLVINSYRMKIPGLLWHKAPETECNARKSKDSRQITREEKKEERNKKERQKQPENS